MGKIGIKELATALTEKHGLQKADAEKFVAAMFDVLNNGLQTDKQVKVKGLGTFKVVSVASRKSVDVNTGEPIIIAGRDKISFTPDATLRDEVNRPFAQFDTVVVNDGVDFSEIDKKYNSTEETQIAEESKDSNDNTDKDKEEKEAAEKVVEEKEDEVEELAKKEEKLEEVAREEKEDIEESSVKEENEIKENSQKEEEEEKEIKEEEKEIEEEKHDEKRQSENLEEEDEAIAVEQRQIDNEQDRISDVETEDNELLETLQREHRTLKYICITAAIVIVALVAGAFYLFNQLQMRDHRIEHLEVQVKQQGTKATKTIVKVVQPKVETKVATDKPAKTNNKPEKTEKKEIAASDAPTKEVKKEDKKEDSYSKYNSDVRIRTGAYNIVGISNTITIRKGQTLSSISRSNLGPGMECYVEAVNGGRTDFKVGDKVNIPKLKLKKKR